MLPPAELYSMIMEDYHKLEEIPPEAHLLCPKVDDDDCENYDDLDDPGDISAEEKKRRLEDAKKRHEITYRLCFLMGLSEEQGSTWIEVWAKRLEGFLTRCDRCVRSWHLGREPFLKLTMEYVATHHHPEANVVANIFPAFSTMISAVSWRTSSTISTRSG